MIDDAPFATVPVLTTPRLLLEPLGPDHFDGSWEALQDEEALRLTGTQGEFTPEQIQAWLESLAAKPDRADWAILDRTGNTYLGEVVLNDVDPDNASASLRIALAGPETYGRGYGTEAIGAVLEHAFTEAGLHRVGLEVFAFNPRARRCYEKCGFTVEGRRREVLNWNGEWIDAIDMGILATDPRPAPGPGVSTDQRA